VQQSVGANIDRLSYRADSCPICAAKTTRAAVIILSSLTTVPVSSGFKDNDKLLRPVTRVISFLVTIMSTPMATFSYRD